MQGETGHTGQAGHAGETPAPGGPADRERLLYERLREIEDRLHEGAHHGPHLAALDLTTWFGMMALFLGLTLWRAARHSLTPHHDAFFERGLAFENA